MLGEGVVSTGSLILRTFGVGVAICWASRMPAFNRRVGGFPHSYFCISPLNHLMSSLRQVLLYSFYITRMSSIYLSSRSRRTPI